MASKVMRTENESTEKNPMSSEAEIAAVRRNHAKNPTVSHRNFSKGNLIRQKLEETFKKETSYDHRPTGQQLTPSFSEGELLVGFGDRIQPRVDR
jgi:hypothetical protein